MNLSAVLVMRRFLAYSISALICASAFSIAVEYELDRPITAKQKWLLWHRDAFTAHHECKPSQLVRIFDTLDIHDLRSTLSSWGVPQDTDVQWRFYKTNRAYRRALHFSKMRKAHYNAPLRTIVSSCDAPLSVLREQWILSQVSSVDLRTWQRIFLAETLGKTGDAFSDARRTQPKALLDVLLSNETPQNAARATLRALADLLQKEGKLADFQRGLLQNASGDDTAVELLEFLLARDIRTIADIVLPRAQ